MSSVAPPEQAERFVEKWRGVELSERAASHEHFIDLCKLVGQATPTEADPTDENYCFEKPVKVTMSASKGSKGESGFVDVWKRGCFASKGPWILPRHCLAQEPPTPGQSETQGESPKCSAAPVSQSAAIMALAAKDARLKKRTLTNLCNERPQWLKLAHEKLDRRSTDSLRGDRSGGRVGGRLGEGVGG